MDLSTQKYTSKHKYTGCDGGLERFKDTGSVKKNRKRLWMAVSNKIDSTLKINKINCGHFAASFSLFLISTGHTSL